MWICGQLPIPYIHKLTPAHKSISKKGYAEINAAIAVLYNICRETFFFLIVWIYIYRVKEYTK